MPFTPFHFGPGLLGKGVAARWYSWSAFVASNVVIDCESLYYLQRDDWPVHRRVHTFVGAAVAGVATTLVLLLVRRALRGRFDRQPPALRSEATTVGIIVGAMAGALSHPLLDGLMHPDIEPFQPWTERNPLRGLVSLEALHVGCVLAVVVGAVLVTLWWRSDRRG